MSTPKTFWRLLELGEKIKKGDEFWRAGNQEWTTFSRVGNQEWAPSHSSIGCKITTAHLPHRRRVTIPDSKPKKPSKKALAKSTSEIAFEAFWDEILHTGVLKECAKQVYDAAKKGGRHEQA